MAAETELQVFQTLQKQEMAAVPSRMQALKEEVLLSHPVAASVDESPTLL